jgi:hypothetical protein
MTAVLDAREFSSRIGLKDTDIYPVGGLIFHRWLSKFSFSIWSLMFMRESEIGFSVHKVQFSLS